MKLDIQAFLLFALSMFVSLNVNSQHSENLADDLDGAIKELAEDYNLKGLAASVVFNDGSIWNGAIGEHGSMGSLSTDMLFEMGSNTKTYTAAIILKMADEGKLSINDSIGAYLSKITDVDMSVTIKQMLNHTSGIYSYTNHEEFGAALNNNPNKVWQATEILNDFLKPMRFVPGENWQYSNTNYLLLGLIIETIDGQAYHESLRKRILEPLELTHSYLDIFESYNNEPRSGTWLVNGFYLSDPFPAFMSSAWAAGGVVSTTQDLALWAKELYSGSFLSKAWTDSMTTQTEIKGRETGYGLGMVYRKYKGYSIYGHGGTTLQHSTMEYLPELGVTLVMVTNEQNRSDALSRAQNKMLDLLIEKPWGLGNELIEASAIRLFPNPANTVLNISGLSGEGIILIKDLNGKTCYHGNVVSNTQISVDTFKQGLYIIEVKNSETQTITRLKFVVE